MTRMQFEIAEVRRLFPSARLYRDNGGAIYWEILVDGYTVNVFYSPDYPYSAPAVYVSPRMHTHHYRQNGELCWYRPGEWNPSFTVATVIGKVMQFIFEYRQGRIHD